ncbi:MAG TPA: DUF6734 family protein, partial [Pyrinomonadaceae bacterium]|nr:DUF6734 family protein [Pyrinomonadaceae bacterium]
MRAVWSFWTKPFEAHDHRRWLSRRQYLLSWILSFGSISKHYPQTALFTDDDGARLLIDQLQLPFVEVSTELNKLAHHDPGFWTMGKLYTYRVQKEPFIHFDNDLFLFKPLPEELASAPVLAQNPEPECIYKPESLEASLSEAGSVWLPAEWVWYRVAGSRTGGDCAGIFGGNRVDFIKHFSEQAIKLVEHPDNQRGWESLEKFVPMIWVEQYLLPACIDYHRQQASSPFHGIEIRYLFESLTHAFESGRAEQLGFTHLAGPAKLNREIAAR